MTACVGEERQTTGFPDGQTHILTERMRFSDAEQMKPAPFNGGGKDFSTPRALQKQQQHCPAQAICGSERQRYTVSTQWGAAGLDYPKHFNISREDQGQIRRHLRTDLRLLKQSDPKLLEIPEFTLDKNKQPKIVHFYSEKIV